MTPFVVAKQRLQASSASTIACCYCRCFMRPTDPMSFFYLGTTLFYKIYEDDIPSSSKIVLLLNHVLPVRAQTYDGDDK
jgi:hypothetical protein